jgi:hypothetical protein
VRVNTLFAIIVENCEGHGIVTLDNIPMVCDQSEAVELQKMLPQAIKARAKHFPDSKGDVSFARFVRVEES